MTTEQSILLAMVVLLAVCVEGIVGFGGNILALPFIVYFLDLRIAVPILMLVPLFNASLRVFSEYKNIYWPAFWKIIVLGLVGGFCGLTMADYLSETVLKIFLGIFMIFVAVKGLYEVQTQKIIAVTGKQTMFTKMLYVFILFLSGFYTGAFACGGPFVAIYVASTLKEKSQFRATMYSTAIITVGGLVLKNALSGIYTGEILWTSLMLIPILLVGYVISSKIQKKVKGNSFIRLVYIVLLIAGCVMFLFSVRNVR